MFDDLFSRLQQLSHAGVYKQTNAHKVFPLSLLSEYLDCDIILNIHGLGQVHLISFSLERRRQKEQDMTRERERLSQDGGPEL